MDEWVCVRECFKYRTLWRIGDICLSAVNPGKHFTLNIDGLFPAGRRLKIVNGVAELVGFDDG